MAITYGFFNSFNGDRTYNADQIGDMFKGLISDGIYESVGNAFIVSPSSGLTISVGSGRAIVDDKWIENDANTTLTLNSAHVTLNRYTAIMLRKDITTRDVSLIMVDGTPASSPSKPAVTRNATTYDICLAYIYVRAGATSITASNIQDTRANTSVCGFVTGLIEQVDTSTLFNQYQAAYNENLASLEAWEASMKAQFDSWLATLTEELKINTYIKEYSKTVTGTSAQIEVISLDMDGYTYEASDILLISINGLLATDAYDYILDTSQTPVEVHLNLNSSSSIQNEVTIRALKSIIGISSNV